MTSQFEKKERLIQALCKQHTICNDANAASKIADVVTLETRASGDVIIKQDGRTAEMFFILSGRVAVMVNDRKIGFRDKNQAVGEMSLVDVGGKRSATVVVEEESELARIEETHFTKIANEHPALWRNIAQSLACRLRERNSRERVKNQTPKVFVASSSESKGTVDAIGTHLSGVSIDLIPWTREGLFAPSTHAIETLEEHAQNADFAIIVIEADDLVKSRGEEMGAPRDNVVFELGLFMGALVERRRVFMVESAQSKVKIPSDLKGLTTLRYKDVGELAQICKQIEKEILNLGTI